MFVLFFAIFIFLSTVFENIFIVSGGFMVCLLTLLLFKKPKQLWLCIFAFLLVIGAVGVYNFRYSQGLYGLSTGGPSTIFIGTGQIMAREGQGNYLLNDGKITYLLASQKDHQIASHVRLVGNVKMTNDARTPGLIFSLPPYEILSGLFHYEFNYDKRLKMKGIQGTIYEQNSIPLQTGDANMGFIASLRIGLLSLVQKSYGNNKIAGLVLGMLIGDRSQIPASDYQSFIDSGLVHLVAVSGGNVIMIVVFLGFILLRLPFYLRNFIILVCIIAYGFLCGMDSSVFRAVIMGGLGMVALFWGRQIDIRRSLIIAFVGMLIYNPYYLVYDVGFLFSFSAIIGIIYFGKIGEIPKKSDKKNASKFLAKIQAGFAYIRNNYLSPSIGATLGILPTMIFFMGRINLLSVIGNLFVLPIVSFVMIYGFISTVLYQIFPRPGILQIEERLIRYIYWVSEKSGEFGLYMNMEGDRIKYLILGVAILWFVWRRIKDGKKEENTPLQGIEKTKVECHELCDS